jgi:rSAM/selenodomain-associated transferase 2
MTESDLEGKKPGLSVILPVLNEAEGINEAIACLRGQTERFEEEVEIIVVDGSTEGSTIKAVVDEKVLKLKAPQGRARQMNAGAARARGDIFLFLHADTKLPPDALALVRAALMGKRAKAGAFDLGFDSERKIFAVTELYVALRTRVTRVPFGDQAIFIRGSYFEHIGGYLDIPLMEDVDLMKRIRKRGDAVAIIPHKVRTSPRRYERDGILYCTFRNMAMQILYAWGVSPERLVKWYR